MTTKKAIKKSIEHWERMIVWVEKQPADSHCHAWIMDDAIGEAWGSSYCALCYLFNKPYIIPHCAGCPLCQKFGPCSKRKETDALPENYWHAVASSLTWGVWLKNARHMLEQLKTLR